LLLCAPALWAQPAAAELAGAGATFIFADYLAKLSPEWDDKTPNAPPIRTGPPS
jgi:hypothetical protein